MFKLRNPIKRKTPEYSLNEIQRSIREGKYHITGRAEDDAAEIFGLLTEEAIIEEIVSVKEEDFQYSMPSECKPDLWQDVYRKFVKGIDAYIKLQLNRTREAVVISLHKWNH